MYLNDLRKLHFFQILLLYKISEAFYSLQCPVPAHWKQRSKVSCDSWDSYICLYDRNENKYTEFCRENPDFEAPGNTVFLIVQNCKHLVKFAMILHLSLIVYLK